jgi:MerR family transcriptional regulator, heat shock protein HspR
LIGVNKSTQNSDEEREIGMTDQDRSADSDRPSNSQGVYGITVTSDLVGTGVQNLRAYEKAGLLDPVRTSGGTRLYSTDDVTKLRHIQTLLAQGLNLAGIAMVLDLEEENQRLRDQLARQRNRPKRSRALR